MLDAKCGEYSYIYYYQLEMIWSNPGTTCVVTLHPDFVKPTFHKFSICFAALEKGFLAGCRKVIGLDGYFFKERSGELLSAQSVVLHN
jgi:hypothetical protein